jgi:hypothetical protein
MKNYTLRMNNLKVSTIISLGLHKEKNKNKSKQSVKLEREREIINNKQQLQMIINRNF